MRLKHYLPVIIGAIIGYSIYHFIGCSTGHCPITKSPIFSTLYGAFAGLLFSGEPESKSEKEVDSAIPNTEE